MLTIARASVMLLSRAWSILSRIEEGGRESSRILTQNTSRALHGVFYGPSSQIDREKEVKNKLERQLDWHLSKRCEDQSVRLDKH